MYENHPTDRFENEPGHVPEAHEIDETRLSVTERFEEVLDKIESVVGLQIPETYSRSQLEDEIDLDEDPRAKDLLSEIRNAKAENNHEALLDALLNAPGPNEYLDAVDDK